MTMLINHRFLKLLFLALLLTGCSNSNSDAPRPGKAHTAEWVITHGTAASGKLDECRSCHGIDLRGQAKVPGCYDCHFGPSGAKTPAGSSVVHGSPAHASLAASGPVCNRCHQVTRQAGKGPGNCHDCHVGVNHPVGQTWLDPKSPTFHGPRALQDPAFCQSCHGADLLGGTSGVSCSSCHFGPTGSKVPDGVVWSHGTVPHATLAPYIAVCDACHSLNRMFGNGPNACHDCHVGATHALGQPWVDKKVAGYHGNIVQQQGTASCTSCHGADLMGGTSGVSCSNCHFGPTGSKVPDGVVWTHGTRPHGTLTPFVSVCNTCHERSRLYGNGPIACHDCHISAPHALGQAWNDKKNADYHGRVVLERGSTSCQSCHGADLLGGSSGVSCSTCHFGPNGSNVPPGTNWQHGTTPHNAYTDQVAVCDACHTRNRLYGNGPLLCHDCHRSPPHALGKAWLDSAVPGYHGTIAPRNITFCQGCHGSDLKGGSSGVSCGTCHFGPSGSRSPATPPPGPGWVHGSAHGGVQAVLAGSAVCAACHQLDRQFGHGPASCHDCHVNVTHPLGQAWIDPKSPTFHGPTARQNPDSCKPCHGANFTGGSSGVSCSTCHFGPTGSKIPGGTNWVHGTTPHNQFTPNILICNTCHERNRLYGNPPGACHDCHTGADHPLGQPWVDFKSPTFHGIAAQQNSDRCKSCHGSDFKGGISAVSCYLCHFGPTGSRVPPGVVWAHGSAPHGNLLPSIAVCNTCHERNRLYGNGPRTCHDCHQAATHPLGQNWMDKKVANYHGATARQNLDPCKDCHGRDLLGGSAGVSCQSCHFNPLGSRIPSGSSWNHGLAAHGAQSAQVEVCNQCHVTDRLYGNPPPSCHDCHLNANHPLGQAWLDKKASGYHGTAAQNAIDSCKACHGADLAGGSSGVSCSSCHFGPAGSRMPPASGWNHGLAAHGTQTAQAAVCNQCHVTDRLYGNPPPSCHDCHLDANHPLGQAWLDSKVTGYHGTAAQNNISSCQQCHGADYRGGSSGVDCFRCHFGPSGSKVPAGVTWAHGTTPHVSLSPYEAVCNQCHTTSRSFGNGPNSCHDCHLGASHPLGQAWLDSKVAGYHGTAAQNNINSCKQCHGADYRGGSSGVDCFHCHFGPSGSKVPAGVTWTHGTTPHASLSPYEAVCNQCHTTSRSFGNGPSSCHDCHGQAGGTGPAHPVHLALPTPANSCTTCHMVTPGVLNFNTQYNAKSGAASFNNTANTCANVSCHGGKVTPAWATGSIDVNTQCSSCHTFGTTQYNGPFTANHNRSDHRSRACTACHDTTRLASTHFTTLNTPALNNPPATIKASINYANGRCANPGCHGGQSW